jgi:predicted transcriptional regulator
MASILKSLQEHLAASSWEDVHALADASGVPFHTIAKIKRGETDNPRVRTVEELVRHIKPAARKAKAAA